MTTATVGAEFAIVYIIGTMAVAAAAIRQFHFRERASMTFVTGNTDMRPGQREVGLQIVVE